MQQARAKSKSNTDWTKAVYDMCRDYLSDRATTLDDELLALIQGRLRNRDIPFLCSVASHYHDPALHGREGLRTLLQVEAFFKKNVLFSDPGKCEEAALSSFLTSELKCAVTNRRLELWESSIHATDVAEMQALIESALGPFSSFVRDIPSKMRVTSGATLALSRAKSFPNVRVTNRPWASPTASRYLRALGRAFGYSLAPRPTLLNRVEFVPKNWKTHRTIACEPEGNSLLQLAFDAYVRLPLKSHFNVDLSDQSRNQRLAIEGSKDGSLATLDLSAASDSASLNLVHLLFPEEWAKFLIGTSSRQYRLPDGSLGAYHKFASMGNGATFPVETLVFAAAVKTVVGGMRNCAVYGDDIIVPTRYVARLVSLLAYLGFSTNIDKSHTEGPFRESCGVNSYEGIDITPFYVRDLDGRKNVLSLYVNSLVEIVPHEGAVWQRCRALVHEHSLRAVPAVEDKTIGVHIHVHQAYAQGLIRSNHRKRGPWQPCILGYSARAETKRYVDSRSLFLWFLRRLGGGERPVESSRYSLGTQRYESKWVGYFPVATGGPPHLMWWGEYLSANAL